jgi:hypothetical protein
LARTHTSIHEITVNFFINYLFATRANLMIRYARWLLPILVLQISACATTADLSGFSDQTTSLMTSVGQEQQEVIGKMSEVIVLTEIAKKEGWFAVPDDADLAQSFDPERHKKLRESFVEQSNDIQKTLEAITSYSISLAELAAAGETGAAAVQKSVGALNNITTNLGGPAKLIGAQAMGILSEISDMVTRAQAQRKIEDAMAILAGPDGALRKTVGLLSQAMDVLNKKFVRPIYRNINTLEKYHYGPGLISFYNNTSSWAYRNRAFELLNMDDAEREDEIEGTSEQEIFKSLRTCLNDKGDCPQANLASSLAARLVLIDTIEKDYRAFENAKVRNKEWRDKRTTTIAQIKETLEIWADQHDAIYTSIASCGGFKAVKPGCGNWSEANFISATEKLRRITSQNAVPANGG